MFRCLCCWFPGWGVFHQKTSAGVEELGEGAEPWPSLLAGTWIHTDAFDCSPNSSNQTGQTFACSCFCMMVLTWVKNETQKMWIFDPITSDLKSFIISVFSWVLLEKVYCQQWNIFSSHVFYSDLMKFHWCFFLTSYFTFLPVLCQKAVLSNCLHTVGRFQKKRSLVRFPDGWQSPQQEQQLYSVFYYTSTMYETNVRLKATPRPRDVALHLLPVNLSLLASSLCRRLFMFTAAPQAVNAPPPIAAPHLHHVEEYLWRTLNHQAGMSLFVVIEHVFNVICCLYEGKPVAAWKLLS